jgi:hypothetical protein
VPAQPEAGHFPRRPAPVEALAVHSFALDWGRFGRIIDPGGSRGTKSLAILKRHARPTALVVDRAK